MWSDSEIHPPFLLPTLFNPLIPFPMLQKAAFRDQWKKVGSPWPEVVLEKSLLYPAPGSARLCSFLNRNNPNPSTPLPWGPGKLGSTVQSDTQHIPSATKAGRMSKCKTPGLWSHASDQKEKMSSISMSASCKYAERSYKCICTSVKFSLAFVSLVLCCARKKNIYFTV